MVDGGARLTGKKMSPLHVVFDEDAQGGAVNSETFVLFVLKFFHESLRKDLFGLRAGGDDVIARSAYFSFASARVTRLLASAQSHKVLSACYKFLREVLDLRIAQFESLLPKLTTKAFDSIKQYGGVYESNGRLLSFASFSHDLLALTRNEERSLLHDAHAFLLKSLACFPALELKQKDADLLVRLARIGAGETSVLMIN